MSEGSEHVARCACGRARIRVGGDPDVVSVCNCGECQRRTGSPFGVGVYYPRERVLAIEGAYGTFTRTADSGRSLTNSFCRNCGTTLYWTMELRPQHVGIAVGCFEDSRFIRPSRVVWAQHRHDWVRFPDDLPVFQKSPP